MTNNAKQEWVVGYEITLIYGSVLQMQLTVTAEDALEAMAEADGLLPDAKADPEVEAVRVIGVAMAEPDAGSGPGLFLGDNVYLYHPKVGAAVIADVSDDTTYERK